MYNCLGKCPALNKAVEDPALTSISSPRVVKMKKIGKLLSEKTANTGDMAHASQHVSTELYSALISSEKNLLEDMAKTVLKSALVMLFIVVNHRSFLMQLSKLQKAQAQSSLADKLTCIKAIDNFKDLNVLDASYSAIRADHHLSTSSAQHEIPRSSNNYEKPLQTSSCSLILVSHWIHT